MEELNKELNTNDINPIINSRYAVKQVNPNFYKELEITPTDSLTEEEKKSGIIYMPYIMVNKTGEEAKKSHLEFLDKKEANGFISSRQFDELHKLCPLCKSSHHNMTLMGIPEYEDKDYVDNINIVKCVDCGWVGNPTELLPKTNIE